MDPGFIAEEIDEISAQIEGDYFDGFEASAFPGTSLPAMALTAAGYEVDDRTGEAISLELRQLLVREGTDIADPQVLAAVAHRHSVAFDPIDHESHSARVMADYDRGRSLNVAGSPHFFTPEGDFFCPALTIGRDDQGRLRVEADPVAFSAFLDQCLGGRSGAPGDR
jgi:predicted DsbA family dithiol-disulfide isomerase